MAKKAKRDMALDTSIITPIKDTNMDLYEYTRENAPDDIVVNVSGQTIIVQAEARDKSEASQRIDPGDRRQGKYYEELTCKNVGLQKVKDVSAKQLEELEKARQIRVGIRPDDWVFESRERAARNYNPSDTENIQQARSNLEVAIGNRGHVC